MFRSFRGLPPRFAWSGANRSAPERASISPSRKTPRQRNLFFRIYAKGLSAVRLKELAAFRTVSPDTEILHHASMPVLSIRPVAGGGSLILWGVPTHPLPLALTAVPVFPELLRQTVFAGSTGHGGTLFAGNVMDPAEVLGTASASGELRYPDDLFPRSRFQWTPSQPVEIYLPLAGFNTFELLIPGRHPERKNLAVNLKRQTGGLLSQKERERLPQTAPARRPPESLDSHQRRFGRCHRDGRQRF